MKYKIAEIALDEEGVYWAKYLGDQINQGGISFGWDHVGSELQTILSVLKIQLQKHADTHKALIAKKEESGE